MTGTSTWLIAAIGLVLTLGEALVAQENCAPLELMIGNNTGVRQISLVVASGDASVAAAGAAVWNGACSQAGTGFPKFILPGGGDLQVIIHVGGQSASDSCGLSDVGVSSSGQVRSAEVWIYDAPAGDPPPFLCDQQAHSLAHELGHVLGLADNHSPACEGRIMGDFVPGVPKVIVPEDCTMVDRQWVLPGEIETPEIPGPGDGDGNCGV